MSQYYDPSPTSEFYFDVANGNYPHHSVRTVFGIGTSTTDLSTVWDNGSIYSYPSSASTMTVSSSSETDVYESGGAEIVQIEGLNANWDTVTEQIQMNGQNAVSTTNSYIRINSMNVTQGVINVGNIYIGTGTVTTGVPANVYAEIVATYGSSLQSFYSVPRNHTAYLINGSIACGTTASNKYVTASLLTRPFGGVLVTAMITTLATGQNKYDFHAPIRIEAKSDIEARAISSSGTDAVATHYQIVLVRES